jgi:hypothetical protein
VENNSLSTQMTNSIDLPPNHTPESILAGEFNLQNTPERLQNEIIAGNLPFFVLTGRYTGKLIEGKKGTPQTMEIERVEMMPEQLATLNPALMDNFSEMVGMSIFVNMNPETNQKDYDQAYWIKDEKEKIVGYEDSQGVGFKEIKVNTGVGADALRYARSPAMREVIMKDKKRGDKVKEWMKQHGMDTSGSNKERNINTIVAERDKEIVDFFGRIIKTCNQNVNALNKKRILLKTRQGIEPLVSK